MTPETICYARQKQGAAPCARPGTCGTCNGIAVAIEHFGNVEVDGVPANVLVTPPTRACHVCQREAIAGLMYKGEPLCFACSPYPVAGEVMLEISDAESESIAEGGAVAGQYLDDIGKTDLADLAEDQWHTFLCKVLLGYSDHMRKLVSEAPPF